MLWIHISRNNLCLPMNESVINSYLLSDRIIFSFKWCFAVKDVMSQYFSSLKYWILIIFFPLISYKNCQSVELLYFSGIANSVRNADNWEYSSELGMHLNNTSVLMVIMSTFSTITLKHELYVYRYMEFGGHPLYVGMWTTTISRSKWQWNSDYDNGLQIHSATSRVQRM